MEYVSARGVEFPALGFGTARMTGETCRSAVRAALAAGYRHVDTAQMYDNESAVGRAIADSSVPREEVFLVTKVHRRNLAYDDVLDSVADSLDRLEIESIDLLLIHAPSQTVPIEESISAMNRLQRENDIEHVGVSNFSIVQLEEAMTASETPIVTNQVRYNPFTERNDLLEFCLENDIVLTAYSPLARGSVATEETLAEMGGRYGKSAAQVGLRWLLQQPAVSAIPKAQRPEHLRENIDVFNFELTTEEMDRIFDLQGGLVTRLRNRLGL